MEFSSGGFISTPGQVSITSANMYKKICFKVEVWKTFKNSTDCHIKTCRSRKGWVIFKIPSTFFQKNLCSFSWLQNETSTKKCFPVFRQNTNTNFAAKLGERTSHSFLLPIWWITFSKHLHSLLREFIEVNDCANIWRKLRITKQPFLY